MIKDHSEFIIEQLTRQGVRLRSIGGAKDIQAYCFQGHDVKSASLHIRKRDGAFICFGCRIHGKNWNYIQQYLPTVDLIPEQNLPDDGDIAAERAAKRLGKTVKEIAIPWDADAWQGQYRHVPQSTLTALDARRWFDSTYRCFRILFPVRVGRELHGWVARRLDEQDANRYYNSPGMEAKDELFPFDYVNQMRGHSVALVEGPYDAVRLVNYGIPALAILGTPNYSPDNKGLLARLGIGRVVVTMDNDEGGERVRYDIARDLRTMFEVEHFFPPPTKDPGNMPLTAVQQLKRVVSTWGA